MSGVQTLSQIRAMLVERGLRPKHALGQNFLIDHNLVRLLTDSAGAGAGDLVLEVGPGTGVLTDELLRRGCRVIAVELDRDLAALLTERLSRHPGGSQGAPMPPRFTLINADCLEPGTNRRRLNRAAAEAISTAGGGGPAFGTGPPFKLIANLPYGAATPLLTTLLLDHPACTVMAVTIQRELGERLSAEPGTKDYGPISVLAALACRVRKVAAAPPACFWPRPEVHSALWMLERRSTEDAPSAAELEAVSRACGVLFAHRRKQLGAVVREHARQTGDGAPAWEQLAEQEGCERLDPTMRAEQLTPKEWLAISRWWRA